jgi:hypothetical protein
MSDTKRYDSVSVVAQTDPDPVNDTPEGHIWFVEGRTFEGDDYRVMDDDGGIVGISTKTVTVIELPELLPASEALDIAREQARELVELARSVDTTADRSGGDDE